MWGGCLCVWRGSRGALGSAACGTILSIGCSLNGCVTPNPLLQCNPLLNSAINPATVEVGL